MKKLLTVLLFVPVMAAASPELLKKSACVACHAVDKKLVGPAFKDVAARYKSKTDAVDYLTAKIKKGGSGVWGPIPMPPQPQLSEADAKKLAQWILTQ